MKARSHYKTEFVSYIPQEMKEGVVYVCLPYNIAAHLCACGCKSEIYTPISGKSGWVLTYDGVNVSLTPSIGNGAYPCRSHYFLQDGKVRWLPPIMTDTQLGKKAKTKGKQGGFSGSETKKKKSVFLKGKSCIYYIINQYWNRKV